MDLIKLGWNENPDMRELQIWSSENELDEMFDDITELESQCRFRDCIHKTEPGCAIVAALKDGTLHKERYESYLLMKLEVGYLSHRVNEKKAYTEKEKFHEMIRRRDKGKYM